MFVGRAAGEWVGGWMDVLMFLRPGGGGGLATPAAGHEFKATETEVPAGLLIPTGDNNDGGEKVTCMR